MTSIVSGFLGFMEKDGTHGSVVGGGVSLCLVIGAVLGAWSPVDVELFLTNAILDPVEAHVHRFGLALTDSSIGDAAGGGVVCLDWSWRLLMAHFVECDSEGDSIASVME